MYPAEADEDPQLDFELSVSGQWTIHYGGSGGRDSWCDGVELQSDGLPAAIAKVD
jgi:hypothetical protein